jgi:hypothetical protein
MNSAFDILLLVMLAALCVGMVLALSAIGYFIGAEILDDMRRRRAKADKATKREG